jgi:hypothetical protein
MNLFILAQASNTPVTDANLISGGAGWAGAGLLGLVLGWLLLKHLPDKDKQFDGLIKSQAEHNKELHKACTEERKEQHAEFSKALNSILERASRDGDRNLQGMQSEMQSLRVALQTLSQAVNALSKTESIHP